MRHYTIYVFALGLLLGCSPGFKIQTDSLHPGNFDDYKTFEFFNPANIPESNFTFNEVHSKILFDAIAAEMQSRGYTSHQNADLMIKVQGGTLNDQKIVSNDRGFYNDYYYSPYYGYDYYGRDRNVSNKETTIIVDIIEEKSNKLIWQGVATGSLKKKDVDVAEGLKEAIREIFSEYPYIAGEK